MAMVVTANVMYGQIVGFLFGFLSAVGTVTTCTWNQWSKTSGAASSSLLNSIWGFNGIWIQCLQYTGGQFQCDDYATALFDLPVYMNTIRAFMCIAIIACVAGNLIALLGMQCSRLFDTMPHIKRRFMLIAAALFAFAGCLVLASLLWYITMLMKDFFSESNQDNALRYTISGAIWIGVTSVVCCFVATLIFACLPGPKGEQKDVYVPIKAPTRGLTATPSYAPAVNATIQKKDPAQYV